MSAHPVKVLIVDDDEDDFFLTRGMLSQVERGSYDVEWAASYELGLERMERSEHDVYLVDYRLGRDSGLDLLRQAKAVGCSAPMILLTGQGDYEVDMLAMGAGADGYLNKGRLGSSDLDRSIRYAITRNRVERERLEMETQIQEAQRRESLGMMAGGIAHDFNNLLAGILGYADLALAELGPGAEVYPLLAGIRRTAQEAAELTNQLLTYTGQSCPIRQPLDLNKTIEDMSALLGAVVAKKAKLSYELWAGLPMIEAAAVQIRQLVMNLVTNASESLGNNVGEIVVRTGVRDCNQEYLADSVVVGEVHQGRYVYFEVSDTGCGMDAETRARMFDPFFTTKFTGRGLGLASVLGIVRGHHGVIRVQSEVGQGTRFEVLFPRLDDEDPATSRSRGVGRDVQSGVRDLTASAENGPAERASLEAKTETPAGAGLAADEGATTVMLVDDEKVVREVVGMALTRLGYRVITASDGREAIELFRAHIREIDAVVLDVTMPVLSGSEALQAIRALRFDVPVVLSSGFGEKDVMGETVGMPRVEFIQKPYLPGDLVEKFKSLRV